jgi:23S rRNA pseudouridine1911/1915/1917 synthase
VAGVVRIVARGVDCARLDRLLAAEPSVGSRRRAREAVETGKVFVDELEVGVEALGLPVAEGAAVEVRWNQPGSARERRKGEAAMVEAGLTVLLRDDDLIAVDKPPGLLTDVADRAQARERDSVKKRLAALLRPTGRVPQVCHRIDRDTSGVVVVACSEAAAERLRGQFLRHEPERIYLAVVHGVPETSEGVWEDHTVWDMSVKRLRMTHPRAPGAMPTRSSWKVVEALGELAVLEVTLDTGRRNQIRLQASLRGHPLVGERMYISPHFDRGGFDLPRQALHARRVGFKHPRTGERVVVEAPIPDDLAKLLARARRAPPRVEPAPERRRWEDDEDADERPRRRPARGRDGDRPAPGPKERSDRSAGPSGRPQPKKPTGHGPRGEAPPRGRRK